MPFLAGHNLAARARGSTIASTTSLSSSLPVRKAHLKAKFYNRAETLHNHAFAKLLKILSAPEKFIIFMTKDGGLQVARGVTSGVSHAVKPTAV